MLGCLLGVAVVLAFAILLIRPISQPGELAMPDGTTVRIEALTFGHDHSFSTAPVRERICRWLPNPLKSLMGKGIAGMKMQTAPGTLVVWMTRHDPSGGPAINQIERHYTIDRHGCKFLSLFRRANNGASNVLMSVVFDTFPKGEDSFDYVISDRDGKTLARFTLANPFKVAPKPYRPEELPITKTNGELVVELRRLANVYSSIQRGPFDPEINVLQAAERGLWEKPVISVFDRFGNHSPGSFCTNERLWKIEANFFQTRGSQFRPDETWRIPKVPIPQTNGIIRLFMTNSVQSARVAAISLQGSYFGDTGGPRIRTMPDEAVTLDVWASEVYADLSIHLRARDDAGRDLIVRSAADGPPPFLGRPFAEMRQQFVIERLPDSRSLDLEIIVQKPVRFEFTVETPPRVSPDRYAPSR